MTLSQDIIGATIPGRVYSPAQVAEIIGYERSSNVKEAMDKLVLYGYFKRWELPQRYRGRDMYAYLRV
ncbi:MAG: hypothetical protein IJV02_00175 [Candidatus Methanomethylophilaceae archaeon]|nr:hypothetical protein [Candidatus Methanomethylophilaceae archaeon]MBR1452420.1 hypothetical protein [Candidatus Methanomethylophilaceae archaeon]